MLTPDTKIFTVAQLTREIKTLLESQIGTVWVSGEISNWSRAASGHAYFSIKEEGSQIDAVIFKARLNRLGLTPENGLEVLAKGEITVYAQRGRYQLVITELHLKGLGALQIAYEKLKKKLAEEGLFDEKHKKKLPLLPRRIGIVTSPSGAAIRDILNVIRRRFSNVHILIYPALVQGSGAAAEIAAGIRVLDSMQVDVMIVGRGGGSLEDLWAFNEEAVVRAIFAAKTPIISAVGHEVDVTLSDLVADLRAPTPSAAAELVVQEQESLFDQVKQKEHRLERAVAHLLEQAQSRLERHSGHYLFRNPERLLQPYQQYCDELQGALQRLGKAVLESAKNRVDRSGQSLKHLSPQHRLVLQRQRLHELIAAFRRLGTRMTLPYRSSLAPLLAQLNSMSPLAVLSRGYALVWKMPDHSLIRKAETLQIDDEITARFASGEIKAKITEITGEQENHLS
ncbi:MAG TPA: exodeoxyribonuclease VII large subunit [Candidatus Hydrogenedentes bacterium]|jgi:exodeoxyribonuclease VII large subunit|nr:exodeoxyribonuclease VII large subunit [Candidatus Hydrogenedentota bacterium]HOD96050.1 exodeoxyribonuclease VII large subunit [Candidatus Hydrogenedentota bacterium]HOR51572.1 exodeoxyribonuclease VII large subunit [Candidatus Hydrogenedentota bacterium]